MNNKRVNINFKTIDKAKCGNARAIKTLYHQYAQSMYSICVRMSNSKEDAEDILQEAFTDAFQNINSYAYEATFGAWLKRIVVNRCINHLKKKKIEFVINAREPEACIDEPDDFEGIALKVEQINSAIMQLPDGYRIVSSLYLLEGYDHKEIAEILNISESTSKSQYMRAKIRIRAKILSYE